MKAQRFHGRSYEINGRLPGRLFDPEQQRDIDARATDVSMRGMGLLCDTPLAKGKLLWLILDDGYLVLEVSNCRVDRRGMYRVGMALKNADCNLESIFAEHACLEPTAKE